MQTKTRARFAGQAPIVMQSRSYLIQRPPTYVEYKQKAG
ncbi:Protein of unknown function [Pyronema omphalodes CBS 100304]|uniref:Uncharacterized protein n=1 Tax=Pyronema omphalodes (strain CBS 100304) TaxID=1076935 RepID=U4KWC8_PYROM|nr:Protein of unknown function [Pyronema omphalodes CBS 100304]